MGKFSDQVITALTIALLFGACETRPHFRRRRSLCPPIRRRDQAEVGVKDIKRLYQEIIPMLDIYVQNVVDILNNTLSIPLQHDTMSNKESIRICITGRRGLVQQVGKRLDSFLNKIVIEHYQLKQFRSNLFLSSRHPLFRQTNMLINGMCSAIYYAGVTSSYHASSGQTIGIDVNAFYLKYLNTMLELSHFIQFVAQNSGIDM